MISYKFHVDLRYRRLDGRTGNGCRVAVVSRLALLLVHILSRSLTQYVIDFGPDSFIYLCESPYCKVGSYIKSNLSTWYTFGITLLIDLEKHKIKKLLKSIYIPYYSLYPFVYPLQYFHNW